MKKKRILIFGMTPLVGGVETYLINVMRNINHEKYEIDLLVKNEISGQNLEGIKGYYDNMFVIPKVKKHPLKAIKLLKFLSKKNHYDFIYVNTCNAAEIIYALPFKMKFKETKIYVHSHNGDDEKKLQHYLFRTILLLCTDKYFACSKIAAKWMFGNKMLKANKITIINNAIETDKFIFNEEIRKKIRQKLKITNEFVIGHIGRFDEQKNHIGLIDIFYELVKIEPNVRLLLIGTGKLEEKVKEHVRELKINDKVEFLGPKGNVNEYYNAMDVFLLPSIFEGLPIVGIEAQANGLECIFSNNITNEVDITGNVYFLPIKETNLWVNKILEIKNKTNKRKDMKEIIKNKKYDMSENIKIIENYF